MTTTRNEEVAFELGLKQKVRLRAQVWNGSQ